MLNVRLLMIINLSLSFCLSLPSSLSILTFYHFASRSFFYYFFSASLLDACNYCVSSFLVHHLAPHRWYSQTFTVDCTNLLSEFAAIQPTDFPPASIGAIKATTLISSLLSEVQTGATHHKQSRLLDLYCMWITDGDTSLC